MKALKSKKKLITFFTLGISLLSVFVAAIATFTWYQLDSQPLSNEMITSSPNITIDNDHVYGYKVNPVLGANGQRDDSNATVTRMASTASSDIATGNDHQDDPDTNFDVPQDGLGYYLIKKNPGLTYKYKYEGVSYSWKLNEFDNSGVKYLVSPEEITVTTSDSFIIRQYAYDAPNYKTINTKVNVTADKGNLSVNSTGSNPTYEITPTVAGTYKVWLNKNTNKVSFEEHFSPTSHNIARNLTKKNITKAPTFRSASTRTKDVVIRIAAWSGWGTVDQFGLIALESTTELVSKPTSGQWGAPFLTNMTNSGGYYWIHVFYNSSISECRFVFRQQQNNQTWVNVSQSLSLPSGYKSGDILTIGSVDWVSDSSGYSYDNYGYNKLVSATVTKTSSTNSGSSRTYYLYDPDGSLGNSPCAYAYYTSTYTFSNGPWHGQAMTYVRDHFYSVTITTTFTKIVFNNGTNDTNKTADLTLNTTGTNVAYDYKSGSWYNPNTTDTTRTYYLYDPSSKISSFNSSVPYAYLWDSTNKYSSSPNAAYPGSAMTATSETYPGTSNTSGRLWKITTSSTFDRIIFNDGRSTSTYKTVDITGLTANHNNAIFVLTSGSGTSLNGDWYLDLPSEDTYTFYYFDNGSRGTTWTNPAVYAWDSANIIDGVYQTTNGIKNLYKSENNTWSGGGIAMEALLPSEATSLNVDANYVKKAIVSQSYDSIIFTNGSTTGGTNQTIDLTGISAYDEYFFVITGTEGTPAKVTGSWHEHIYSVEYYATFWLNGTTKLTFDSKTAHLFNGEILSPNLVDFTFGVENFHISSSVSSSVPSSLVKSDSTNGIIYGFDRVGSAFYTDEDCGDSDVFTDGEVLPLTDGTGKLYVKYSISASSLVSIYVDDASWSNEYLAVKTSGNDAAYFTASGGSSWNVATGLYRVTLRDDWMIQLSSGTHTNYNLTSNDGGIPNMGSGTNAYYRTNTTSGTTYDYLYISSSGAGSSWSWVGYKPTSASNVWVQKYNGSTWNDVANGQLLRGDGVGNNYIYESGLQLTSGDIIRVYDKSTDTAYGYNEYVDANKTKHAYVATALSGGGITLSNFTSTARFNFYITTGGYISIAMVPDRGNGFYIMNYNASYGFENYIGSIKMNASSPTSATYTGFRATSTTKIFIRSYIDAVDVLYKAGSNGSGYTINNSTGLIEFSSPGYYNIFVTNGVISIESYRINDFFKLNPLDTTASKIATRSAIHSQKTSLIIEVPFTSNNTYKATISMNVDLGDLSAFVGTALYISSSKISEDPAAVYSTIRGNNSLSTTYSALSNSAVVSDSQSVIINANTGTTYYAYILIDYLPTSVAGVSYTNFTTSAYLGVQVSFHLRGSQYIPS